MKLLLPATGLALFFGVSLGLTSVAQANNFSPERTLIKRESSISLEEAQKRSSARAKSRRPGLGSFTRRVQNRRTDRTGQTRTQNSDGSERRIRTSTRRISGGRNGYARYLRSLAAQNTTSSSSSPARLQRR